MEIIQAKERFLDGESRFSRVKSTMELKFPFIHVMQSYVIPILGTVTLGTYCNIDTRRILLAENPDKTRSNVLYQLDYM